MFAGVQSQAVVNLLPHPPGAVSPLEDNVGNVPRSQLLRDSQPTRPRSHDDCIETLMRQFVQAASAGSDAEK